MDLKDRRLKSFAAMKEMFMLYYMNAKMMEGQQKIAWVTSGAPVEPLYALDVIPIYPENHGALIGTAKMGPKLCEAAEKLGFSPDVCSYARADFGQIATGESPVMGLPKPDFLVCCTNICGTVLKWYEELARIHRVPLIVIDTPFIYDRQTEHAYAFVRAQMESYLSTVERLVGRKFDPERMQKVADLAKEGMEAWKRILRLCRHKPAPMSCFDAFVHMAPIVTMRGTQQCLDYYVKLEAELRERIAGDFGAIPEEKYRVLWDNLPIWHEMSFLSEFLAEHRTCMVADTYTNAWADNELDFSNIVAGLAKTYADIYLNISMTKMVDKMAELAKLYEVDGVVMHSNRSCKPYSFGQYDMARMLNERLQTPVVVVEADMTDSRQYDREQTARRLEAFVEMMAARA
ncbi:MAG: 2-hydroxyglutaryl-CoA dehydratase [Myxococcales bacterium]|nr:MAG: 2-hydroxyglutaryl-CoA dehydratase [Myxococcales bacterium]